MAKKKKNPKRHGWNKGKEVRQSSPFDPSDATRIKNLLPKRCVAGLRDLAPFSPAIDMMLRASDLLGPTVKDA